MDELSERAQRLIADAMDEDEPPPEVTNTGWSAIADRISRAEAKSEAPVATGSVPAVAPRRFPRWLMLPVGIVLAGGIAWVVTHATRDAPKDPPQPRVVEPEPAPPVIDDATKADRREATRGPSEAELIAEAEAALARNEPERALEVLDRHALRFPMGEHADDRLVLRIEALCALGRVTEAKAEAEGVRRVRPDSRALPRLADTCAAP